MIVRLLAATIASVALGVAVDASNSLKLIPLPKHIEETPGVTFTIDSRTEILYQTDDARESAEMLASYLRPATGHPLRVSSGRRPAGLFLSTKDADRTIGPEGYSLQVDSSGVTIRAATAAGLFYGIQTLRQLLPPQIFSDATQTGVEWRVPGLSIRDEPSFPWRGMMLDVSRYFFNKDFVLRYLDIMALHKMNVFHWHIIDDPGWRIEIKKYPRLTQTGGFRGKGQDRYGGYYTQDEIRTIVAYAAKRHIKIIPEIELPAHTLSAIVAYPDLCCTGKQMEIPTRHFISRDLYCAGSDFTWKFLRDVMSEVCDLFPGEFVHIGGDEAKYDRWRKCPKCQARKTQLGLKSEKELQGWMTREIEEFLQARGKQILGWDEILSCGITNKAGIMTWHRPKTANEGARRGNPVVMALTGHCYFDTPESKLPGEPPAATWLRPISLRQAYEWHPVPAGLRGEAVKNILGGHGCVWSDQFIHGRGHLIKDPKGGSTAKSESYIEYLTLPRAAALAEVTWTPRDSRNWEGFYTRMQRMYLRYISAGYGFRMPVPEIAMHPNADGSMKVSGTSPVEGGSIRYTTDGSKPTASSLELSGAVTVDKGSPYKAATFAPDGRHHSLVYEHVDRSSKHSRHGLKLGQWKAGQVGSRRPRPATFDGTGLINGNGLYTITFIYTRGGHRLDIHGVEVIKNGTESIASDRHKGFTGGRSSKNQYRINIKDYETGASFKVRALICGDIGNDSNGLVFIRKGK